MPVHAVQMIRLAVQEKSLVRVHRIKSQPQRLLDRIHDAVRRAQFHHRLVKIRVLRPFHKCGCGTVTRSQYGAVIVGREHDFLLAAGHGFPFASSTVATSVCHWFSGCHWKFARSRPSSPLFRDFGLQPGHARRTMVSRREIFLARHEQMHRTIQSAINRKIAAQWRDVRLRFIVSPGRRAGSCRWRTTWS